MEPDKVPNETPREQPIIHAREDSDKDLNRLFEVVLKPSKETPLQKPFKMRNFPPSFFQPPKHRQSPIPTIIHSREGSTDSTGGGGPIRVGPISSPAPAPQHFRHHSSPATLQQKFAVAVGQQPSPLSHARQHSFDVLSEEPLPQGWEEARTPEGNSYYIK